MTVIACRDGVVASDSAIWHGETTVGYTQKLHRLDDGSIFAAAGTFALILCVRDWINAGRPADTKPAVRPDDELDALILRQGGRMECWSTYLAPWQSMAEYEACGAHSDFLYGAMAAGASAEDAVRLAIQRCSHAGGDIQVERAG
jgi:hypothetical protein